MGLERSTGIAAVDSGLKSMKWTLPAAVRLAALGIACCRVYSLEPQTGRGDRRPGRRI